MCRQKLNRACTAKARASETQQQAMCRQERDTTYTAKARASETQQQTMCRRELNRACTAKARASETQQQTMCRRELNRACTAKAKASETQQQTMCRRELNRACTAKKRALESPKDTLLRKQSNRTAMAKKRNADMSLAMAIENFQSLTKLGPEFVCTCCHRMMYKQSVVSCNPTKYAKIESAMLDEIFHADHAYVDYDGKKWLCNTCDRALSRGNMPLQAKAKGLQLLRRGFCTIVLFISFVIDVRTHTLPYLCGCSISKATEATKRPLIYAAAGTRAHGSRMPNKTCLTCPIKPVYLPNKTCFTLYEEPYTAEHQLSQ